LALFLQLSSQEKAKEHQLRVAHDQKLVKNANFYTLRLTFCGITLLVVFYSFLQHFCVVFENISFNISKNCKSKFFGRLGKKKWLFSKVTLEAHSIFIFLCILLLLTTKVWISAFRSKKQNRFISAGSVFILFQYSKNTFLTQKFYAFLCALLKKCISL
jgi:hypothetical protein